ncbi:TetR/AcrR family transcriptional regulator [Hoyosella rhizosphaerae]|uniref:TetR family transcriptional regulator n=1 Tax=Hoyosella rhizosphaerae TaxID=1755582 RepID=A0A916X921_9ACTN|nr:TetR/AcrR family transcriptional regulator [Hoyosella rhizosphaerae]MBN4926842.1 TetR/AcrR family transcriptional regulator [Hoyosella rhizosphaerae]GGC56081.1 TetR family transcriptional regulator [Hoyosella rhizosphaerae]
MLEAAFDTFADEGFGRATVENICECAGYTRGAFYSNFASLDDLFLEMWRQKSGDLIARIHAVLEELPTLHLGTPAQVVEHVLAAVPVDDKWYRITAEFTAHSLRNPSLLRVMASREQAISDEFVPLIEELLRRTGRIIPDPVALGQALVAVHDGTTVQVLTEPDNEAVRRRRIELFTHVVLAYSTETEGIE